METVSRVRWFTTITNPCSISNFPATHPLLFPPILRPHKTLSPEASTVCAIKTSTPESDLVQEDVMQTFLKERHVHGDFISKTLDMIWQSEYAKSADAEVEEPSCSSQGPEEVIQMEADDGFLKLAKTQEWVLGLNSAPMNQKAVNKGLQDGSERRKRLNLLKYEALKREILFLTVSIGTACSGYCLVTLSVQAAISYAVGVLFSCVYLQLLNQYADNLRSEAVPLIFKQKKFKKIGIRSEDLQNFVERVVKGSSLALSSPRLVIPGAIYGLWILSRQHFAQDVFDFQLVPAMFGMFAYKAAALIQVYRDNEDLQLIFPESIEGSND